MADTQPAQSAVTPQRPRPTPQASGAGGRERRKHTHLRELIDEMLASLRVAAKQDLFTAAERADAEVQLASIMERVHAEALKVSTAH